MRKLKKKSFIKKDELLWPAHIFTCTIHSFYSLIFDMICTYFTNLQKQCKVKQAENENR